MQIDIGTIEADPLSVGVKKSPRPRRSGRQNTKTTSWKSRFATPEKQAMVIRGMQMAERWLEGRAARVEELRALVEAGTYRIDSRAIAESMLQNQTHFLDEN